ncbi:DNA-binding transcriptional regulator, IclR family [Pseudonocardia thermophila]|jgi:Transcriptional regulator|uniref:DNA-binding transcriptional regulator, IclR family n=1 Tax=Pseudonocardia thermophila TaxID=1848 RepID=A0A1M6PKC4_PSETH|nr:helix-turn-helix domain-containing protein [Pseudonocardia thermophila]SHK08432.1 DNA-binding transcriptional regulator, IclR family [Pseudonocardia thermophila]
MPRSAARERPTTEPPGGDIQVIARVVALLDCLDPDHTTLDTATTARVLGVGRSTAHRYLASLEKGGLLRRTDPTTYELGPVLARLGTLALSRLGVLEAARPIMRELVAEIRNTVVLSVWGGRAPVIAAVVPDTSRITTISVEIGRSLPPDAAQSRVFAAYLPTGRRVTRRRTADPAVQEVDGLLTARHTYEGGGFKTVAVPVLTADGEIVAALAAVGLSFYMPDEQDDALAARLVAASRRITVEH